MVESRADCKSRIHAAISLKFSDHTSIPGVFKLDIVVLLRLFGMCRNDCSQPSVGAVVGLLTLHEKPINIMHKNTIKRTHAPNSLIANATEHLFKSASSSPFSVLRCHSQSFGFSVCTALWRIHNTNAK